MDNTFKWMIETQSGSDFNVHYDAWYKSKLGMDPGGSNWLMDEIKEGIEEMIVLVECGLCR